MKRKAALLLGMVLAISGLLCGCGGSADRVAGEKTTQKEENTSMEQTERRLKTGLALMTDISGSKDAGEDDGLAQSDISVAAVTVDEEGKIVTCAIDSVQVNINFGTDGKIVTDNEEEFPTKQELADAYGMKQASAIGKEWNEQADAFAAYCVGKTVEEVGEIAVTESGMAADTDLAASCSINIGGFKEIVVKAVNNAK